MPLTPEQLASRKRVNTIIFRVLSIPFLVLGLLIAVGTPAWWLGLLFLVVGAFLGLTWIPGMVKR